MNDKRCVLAYSGGLDTTAIVVWLQEQGYEVHAVLVDVGQEEDTDAHRAKALRFGAATAVIRDVRPVMLKTVIPRAIGLAATYEGNYRLGTALARPFIAAAQVERARELGGATLVHGATGKGNDQIRFEFAYRSLAESYPVLAPWKTWSLAGRRDLVEYLRTRGCRDDFDVIQRYSMDENLWHLSVEGGDLEDPETDVDVTEILASVADRFGRQGVRGTGSPEKDDGDAADTSETAVSRGAVEVSFRRGVPVGLAGRPVSLGTLIGALNHRYRHAPWAWDLVIENRFTGIKSRGIYINPAARLLHQAIDGLARTCLNKPTYDRYVELGREYGTLLYRGEYFSQQRLILEAAADAVLTRLSGSVTMRLDPTPYVARIASASATFDRALASFEGGGYRHAHAEGFIALSWLSSIGRRFEENRNGDLVEAGDAPASDVCPAESMSRRGLVPTPV